LKERLKKNTQDLMVFLFSQEIYKKNTQDLDTQLHIAYKKIRELLDKLRKTEEIEDDYIT
jgi:hypothetical protein